MKFLQFKRSKLRLFKQVDLIDGQRRGERVFRRLFFLFAMYFLVVFAGRLYLLPQVENETHVEIIQAKQEEPVEVIGIDAAGKEWVDGQEFNGQIVEVVDGKAFFIQVGQVDSLEINTPENQQIEAIRAFTQSYGGSRIDNEYFSLLENACADSEVLRLVVAISVAESGMGRDLPYRQSNFWGWFKGGNSNYDPSREVMAQDICTGIATHYMNVRTDVGQATRYVGYNPAGWMANVNWAYAQMEVK